MTTHESLSRVRLDKWLWAARFFKTRALAVTACERGRVRLNGSDAKPGKDVQAGDWIFVVTPGGEFEVRVLDVSDVRGPAKVAQTLYEETPASRAARERAAEMRRLAPDPETQRQGRPTKRERRDLDRLRSGR
ncbi:MAG TPA: RNA-binding S4 domain-containing protein [Burkholderiaceae bacterium]|nr:RNA-binding S4 domain-containing protein [Burkholderiaceae bacterium]